MAHNPSAYAALIRTFNSEHTLPATVASLREQSPPPAGWVFVDSGSTDGTLQLVPGGAVVRRYAGAEFNYSAALNQGVAEVRAEFVLVISSHTSLASAHAVEYAMQVLRADPLVGAAYFTDEREGGLRHEMITGAEFDGFNGVWNTCALHRTALLRERPFRPEVFTAEDQEWSAWWLRERGGKIARIRGAGKTCVNARNDSPLKRLNEYVAVAWFAQRSLLGWRNIWRQLGLALRPGPSGRLLGRGFHMRLAARLLACRFRAPRYKSKYF